MNFDLIKSVVELVQQFMSKMKVRLYTATIFRVLRSGSILPVKILLNQ